MRISRNGPAVARGSVDQGFILVTVLWLLALFAVAVAVFSRAVVSDIRVTRNIAGAAVAEALADAGVALAILDLVREFNERAPPRFPRGPGEARTCALENGRIAVSIADASGRVDLNRAPARLLAALFAGHGVEPLQAMQLATRIIDYRDPDNVSQEDGAEEEAYRAAGMADGPRNAPFETLAELGRVLEVPSWLPGRIAGDVTLYSGQVGIDPAVAAKDLMVRLSDGFARLPGGAGAASGELPGEVLLRSPRRSFVVVSTAEGPDGSRFVREASVEIGQRRGRGYAIRSWRRQVGDGALVSPDVVPPC